MVMNERIDRFSGGPLKAWHGVGVFFVKDGKIVEWYRLHHLDGSHLDRVTCRSGSFLVA